MRLSLSRSRTTQPDDQRHVIDILAALPGHQIFHNIEEVDAYMREERDSWEG